MTTQPAECAVCELSDRICESCEHEARLEKLRSDMSGRLKKLDKAADQHKAKVELRRQKEEFDKAKGLCAPSPESQAQTPPRKKRGHRKKKASRPAKEDPPSSSENVSVVPSMCSVVHCCAFEIREGLCQTCLVALGFWEKNHRDRARCPMVLTDEQATYFKQHFS